jgi:predicted RNA-binding protein with PUA-like domain
MKSEPDVFSIDDLSTRPNQTEPWDGVRNHQAKKILQSMQIGDRAFFYHSSAKPPGIIGLVTIVREAYPDPAQFDSKSKYYDAKSSEENPKWVAVDVKLERKLERLINLEELKVHVELGDMSLFKHSRLSVQPVEEKHWDYILGLEHENENEKK